MSRQQFVEVRVPGSSANLGPGFDTMAIALSVRLTLKAELLQYDDPNIPLIICKGSSSPDLPVNKSNLVYRVFSDVWQNNPSLLDQLRITIDSDIPVGKGLGSSGAAVIAALMAAYKLIDKPVNIDEIISRATFYEGHAENACSSLYGGLVICAPSSNGDRIITRRLSWPEDWKLILTVPPRPLSTKESRNVIPAYIQHRDAIHNVQYMAMFIIAVSNRDAGLMSEALHDKLHQPYRVRLVPELAQIPAVLKPVDTIGTVLSGAGSSVLTIVQSQYQQKAMRILTSWANAQEHIPRIIGLEVNHEGSNYGFIQTLKKQ
jgi:homoserine kinase